MDGNLIKVVALNTYSSMTHMSSTTNKSKNAFKNIGSHKTYLPHLKFTVKDK